MSRKLTIHEWLERYYHYILIHTKMGKRAMNYLNNRGITKETIKKFKLGFSPFDVKPTLEFIKGKGFSFNDLVSQKLLTRYKSGKYKGKLTDPFKNRITFPIQNHHGKTVGFGGRTLNKNNKVKYINSPESNVFVKGDNLYGFHLAKDEIKRLGYVIIFEGYFDVITAYQSKIKNSVSTLGTALTVNQALLIKDITKNVVIAFDGDDAGKEASFKSASILKDIGCNVRIAHIHDDLDPDDYIQKHGGNQFKKEIIQTSKGLMDSFIEYKKKDYNLTTPNDRFLYANEVLNELPTNNTKETIKVLKGLGNTLHVPLKDIYKKV